MPQMAHSGRKVEQSIVVCAHIVSGWRLTGWRAWGPCPALQEGEDASPERLQVMLKEALEQTSSPGGGCRQCGPAQPRQRGLGLACACGPR